MPARETVDERDDHQGGTYRLEKVRCGKDRCTRCAGGPAHGPYWYRYYRGRGGKVVSKYVGKTLPADAAAGLARRGDAGQETGPARDQETARAAAAAASTPDRVIAAYRALTTGPGDFVQLAELRRELAGVPRAELDATLGEMYRAHQVNVVSQANQEALTDADRAAVLEIGGSRKHRISIEH